MRSDLARVGPQCGSVVAMQSGFWRNPQNETRFLRRELMTWGDRGRLPLSSIARVLKNCYCDYQKCLQIGSDWPRRLGGGLTIRRRVCAKHHTLFVVMVTTLLPIALRTLGLCPSELSKCASPKATVLSPFATFDKASIGLMCFKKKQACGQKASPEFLEARF